MEPNHFTPQIALGPLNLDDITLFSNRPYTHSNGLRLDYKNRVSRLFPLHPHSPLLRRSRPLRLYATLEPPPLVLS